MTTINTNLAAIKARLQANKTVSSFERAATRLATGLRLNSSSDDAAGSSVANKLASQLAGIKVALRNTADGISLVQTALNGMSTSMSVAQRLREITLQASNGIYTASDRQNAQSEVQQLLIEMKRIANTTNFNGVSLLDGSYDSTMRVGNFNREIVAVAIDGMGINKNIEGKAFAAGSSIQILSPEETASGSSSFETPLTINATGGSAPVFLSTSSATGTSAPQSRSSSVATGSSAYTILANASGTGTSSFNVQSTSLASGSGTLNYLANTNATGTSSFNTPSSSQGVGTSALDVLTTNNAAGTSNFNTATSSTATGTSVLDFLLNTNGTGSSQFSTPTSTSGAGTSVLDVLSTNNIAITVNSSDSANSSTATGSSSRQILSSSIGTGSSAFNILPTSRGTGSSSAAGVLASTAGSIKYGGASRLVDVAFDNYNFTEGVGTGTASSSGAVYDVAGWEIHLKQVALGSESTNLPTEIGGFATPTDTNQPTASPGDETAITSWLNVPISYSYEIANNSITIGTNDVKTTEYGQVHGPYIISKEALSLQLNDTISFDWQAVGSGDAADVYAYLLNVDDGSTVELFNYTHPTAGSTPLATVNTTLQSAGNYKFVFVSGSYDATGGTKVGSSLSISNIQIDQVNPSQSSTTIAEVTIESEEAERITISRSLLGELDRIADADPGLGTFSIRQNGSDYNKFTIDANGNISSTQPLLRQTQASYDFEVRYTPSTGGSHTERVTLELLNSTRATSTITAQEANSVQIERTALTLLNSFASADNFNGNFAIKNSGSDYQKFSIDGNGNISSLSALDFDVQKLFNFEIIYNASDGRQFTNEITLNLTDTLSSTASITAEESNSLSINASSLTSTRTYATKVSGGSYSLSGADAAKFSIDSNGNITSNAPVLLANQGTYNFSVNYIGSQGTHVEAVTLTLTEALQSISSLTVNESAQATITPQTLSKLNNFASADNYGGSYRLESNATDPLDYTEFSIANDGTITSNVAMNYATENRYDFDVIYRSTTGIEYRETVTLNVANPNSKSSTIEAEETLALTLTADKFVNTAAFAALYPATPSYSLAGTDAALFSIDSAGIVTSNQSLAMSGLGTYNHRQSYNFDIVYSSGANTQTEAVKLIITEALQSNSSITAAESDQITIEAAQLSKVTSFAARDRYRGNFAIAATGGDYSKFLVDQTGKVQSVGALDFTTQPSYNFDVTYTASDGRVFTETVALNLTDTLTSTATILTEETQALTIHAATMASTYTYANRQLNAGGTYSIGGTDSAYFQVDNLGNVTSTQNLLRSNKDSFEFDLTYNAGGSKIHTETVTVNLSEALQGTSTVSADESGKVTTFVDGLTNLSSFASRDGSNGTYSIVQTGPDYTKFVLNANGNIESIGALDFTVQQQYQFDVAYRASDGRIFTDTVVLNLNDTLTSQATMRAVETLALTIPANQLASTKTYATRSGNTGGSYSLAGVDADKFSISNSGEITSVGNALVATQDSFNFDVVYNAGPGKVHTESVNLYLSETLNATSTISAAESDKIIIQKAQMQKINAFAGRDGFAGSFAIEQSGLDYNNFRVLNDGTVESTVALDFTDKPSYQFDVTYTGSDGRVFVETVNLNLTDSLQSTAVLTAEETQALTIPATNLTATNTYANRAGNTGGSYSLTGTDAGLFQIDANGVVTSTGAILQSNKSNYAFTVVYDAGSGKVHNENVSLSITEALQSTATVTAAEAAIVTVNGSQFTQLDSFASRDNYAGYFYINESGSDFRKFSIDRTNGTITANQNLDFTVQPSYSLDVRYRASDNRVFASAVSLHLTDTLNSTATMTAEETQSLSLNAASFTSTHTYASRSGNSGGTYSITGIDQDKFSVDSNGNVTSTQALLVDTQQSYNFNLIYQASPSKTHTEAVTLNLDRARQGTSTLNANESNKVNIPFNTLSIVAAIAAEDNYEGSFSIAQTGNDFNKFHINSIGTITSNGALDYASQASYTFDVIYNSSDGERYVDTVTLNLSDTLIATASVHGEESDLITIAASEFSSTQAFAALHGVGGTYGIDPNIADGAKFTIDTSGNVSAIAALRRSEKSAYNFVIDYTAPDGQVHNENVTLTLDRFLQATSSLQSQESARVNIERAALTDLNNFVTSDGGRGTFRLGTRGNDHSFFSIDSSGNISSLAALDYDTKNQFDFDVIYQTRDGRQFTNAVTLDISDSLSGKTALSVEESTKIKIDATSLTSMMTYAAKDTGSGQFSIDQTGSHYSYFDIDGNGNLTANRELKMNDFPTITLDVRYNGVGIPDFVERLTIVLTPTTYDTTRSALVSAEASEVIIIPNENPFLKAYAEADQHHGRFEIAQSADNTSSDFINFSIDAKGTISSIVPIDFESGKVDFNFTVYYYHSTNGNKFTDFVNLKIVNDKRDDNNLALEDISVLTPDVAKDASSIMNQVVEKISAAQSKLGATENRLLHNIDNLSMNSLVTEKARGRIIDANFASETASISRARILQSAATAMLAQANNSKQSVMALIK